MEERDPDRLADQLEHEADDLEHRSQELRGDIEDVRQDWHRKRADDAVPGAAPEEGSESSQAGEDQAAPEHTKSQGSEDA